MSWSKVAGVVSKALPVLGTALGGPLGGAAGGIVASLLGVKETPEAVLEKLQADPEAIKELALANIESHTEIIKASLAAEVEQLKTVNATMKAEYGSGDKFVSRWRPFFGYIMAVAWLLQVFGTVFVCGWLAIANPVELGAVVSSFATLWGTMTAAWSVALAVVGVSVHKRSKDKQLGVESVKTTSALDTIKQFLPLGNKSK